jgi:hypothetical protein
MNKQQLVISFVLSCVIVLAGSMPVSGAQAPVLLASGLEGAMGSTIGPDGALYVTEGATGKVSRVDPQSGEMTAFASGLPRAVMPIGGAVDVAFMDETAYVLVSMVGSDLDPDSEAVAGIYRVDGPDRFTVIADLGTFSINNPSESEVSVSSGVYHALDLFDGGFVVTDGHHNRVLQVTLEGNISVMKSFDNIVPTGLAVGDYVVYMAEAGANPHSPESGKIVAFGSDWPIVDEVASGAPLLVDVECGPNGKLYALSQGDFPTGSEDGSPALENTGSLVMANADMASADGDGFFTVIIDGLNQPASLEFIENTAYIVTLTGEIWVIDGIS